MLPVVISPIEPGLLRYPDSAALVGLRHTALRRMAELHQQLDPFRFLVYAELAAIEVGPVRLPVIPCGELLSSNTRGKVAIDAKRHIVRKTK